MSSDRAAVAREVLTELLEFAYARAETVSDTRQFMRERYPAPPAPETVTVGGRVWAREVDGWWVHHSDISHDVCGPRSTIGEMCARIASDARALKERDARIAELETQLQRALDGAVFHEKRAHHAEQERDAALRALEEAKVAIGAALAELTSRKNDKHRAQYAYDALAPFEGKGLGKINGAEQAPAEEPADRRVTVDAAPAPIPLGETMEVDGVKWARTELGWNGGAWRYRDSSTVARVLTAIYHARHPVATRETVERVALAVRDADLSRSYLVPMHVYHKLARAALTAAGFTLEEGA